MELIIDIDEKKYEEIKRIAKAQFELTDKTEAQIIATGIPLPKGHGRLIDADTYRKDMMNSREFNFFKILDMQSTVVEADKGGSNNEIHN